MVRLKVYTVKHKDRIFNLFQFHDGTIKSLKEVYLKQGLLHFNSTMVRLKDSTINNSNGVFTSFQFHDGTIKRQRVSEVEGILSVFQFHDGTIKRYELFNLLHSKFHFNSTMVRLKVL